MIWGAIAYGKKLQLLCIDGHLTAKNYIQMLDENVIGIVQQEMENDCTFQ